MMAEDKRFMPRFAREKIIERLAITDSMIDESLGDNAIKGEISVFRPPLMQLVQG